MKTLTESKKKIGEERVLPVDHRVMNLKDLKVYVRKRSTHQGYQLKEKIVNSIKTRIRKIWPNLSEEERDLVIHTATKGMRKQIEINHLIDDEAGFGKNTKHLLFQVTSNDFRKENRSLLISEEEREEKMRPRELLLTIKDEHGNVVSEEKAYTNLNEPIEKKRHNHFLQFSKSDFANVKIYDWSTLLAETIIDNGLERFVRENDDIVKMTILSKGFSKKSGEIKVPVDPKFQMYFLQKLKEYELISRSVKKGELKTDGSIDIFKDLFFEKRDEAGFVEDLGHAINLLTKDFLDAVDHQLIEREDREEKRKTYAREYETKMSITKSTEKLMKNTSLLEKFSFIEFDDSVKEEKIESVERDVERFYAFFNIASEITNEEYTFRIRKLGKTKAKGTFFPEMNNIVVDPNYFDSFVHEFGHLLDYYWGASRGTISQSAKWNYIRYRYEIDVVETNIPKLDSSDPFVQQWFSKKKFNANYYLESREVFARLFENYVADKGFDGVISKTKDELSKSPVHNVSKETKKAAYAWFDEALKPK